MMLRTLLAPVLASLVATTAAAQSIFVVDADGGPGVDFTALQPALDASSPGDRIEVFAGTYGPATLGRGVTVMGAEAGVVFQSVTIEDLPPAEIVVLADVGHEQARIERCMGTVVLDRVALDGFLDVTACADVRMSEASGLARISVVESFVQIGQSTITAPVSSVSPAVNAFASELVISDTTLRGASELFSIIIGIGMCQTFDGHPGLVLGGGSTATVLRSVLRGGSGSIDCFGTGPGGFPGPSGTVDSSSTLRRAQTAVPNGLGLAAGAIDLVEIELPTLSLTGGRAPGETAVFETRAGAGTSARLWAGRFPRRDAFGPWIPFLHSRERGVSLGAMPASELVEIFFPLPPLPRGTLIHGQAMRTRADGTTDLSNSVTLVVR
ncbi:MAG: hypothetical protein AAFU73_20775 [Planctomycetota bacterium]